MISVDIADNRPGKGEHIGHAIVTDFPCGDLSGHSRREADILKALPYMQLQSGDLLADEISKLAQETASSIREIESLIQLNNTEISRGMSGIIASIEMISGIINSANLSKLAEELKKTVSFFKI